MWDMLWRVTRSGPEFGVAMLSGWWRIGGSLCESLFRCQISAQQTTADEGRNE